MDVLFDDYLQKEKVKTREAVRRFLAHKMAEFGDLDPSFTVYLANLEEYSLRGGKWHRPMLVRLAYSLFVNMDAGGDIWTGSGSVELLHRFLLIHDDIFDGDLERHGAPTLEAIYKAELTKLSPSHPVAFFDKGMAMISGDLLHTFALEMAREAGFAETVSLQVLRGLHECLAVTAAGWRLETLLKQQKLSEVEVEKVEKAMWLVSGQYSILWPLRIGQLFAGVAYGEWNDQLETYGKHIGLAFQIQDDILGIMGATEKTGKPVGHDFREGKKSLLLLHAFDKSNAEDKEFLENHLGSAVSDELDRIQQIIKQTGAVDEARKEIKKHLIMAQEVLDSLEGNTGALERLRDLGAYLGNRNV